jgi:hypothetical protein
MASVGRWPIENPATSACVRPAKRLTYGSARHPDMDSRECRITCFASRTTDHGGNRRICRAAAGWEVAESGPERPTRPVTIQVPVDCVLQHRSAICAHRQLMRPTASSNNHRSDNQDDPHPSTLRLFREPLVRPQGAFVNAGPAEGRHRETLRRRGTSRDRLHRQELPGRGQPAIHRLLGSRGSS